MMFDATINYGSGINVVSGFEGFEQALDYVRGMWKRRAGMLIEGWQIVRGADGAVMACNAAGLGWVATGVLKDGAVTYPEVSATCPQCGSRFVAHTHIGDWEQIGLRCYRCEYIWKGETE
jgi:ribosomal protein S27AE